MHTALRADNQGLCYADLNREANMLAHAILARRENVSEPIPFILEHGPAGVIAMLGIMKAGKAYVPVDPFYPPAWITHILDDIHASLVITNNQNLPLTMTSLETPRAAEVLNLDALDHDLPNADPRQAIAPGDMAYILYTSGSTGRPRGAIHSHQDAMHNMIAQTNDLALSPSDRFALFISFGFEASRFAIYGALHNGGVLSLYDIRSKGLGGLPDWIDQEEISVLLCTPSTFRYMSTLIPENRRFASVRLIVLGGESVSSQDVRLFRQHFAQDCVLVNTLGTTETGIITRYLIDYHSPLDSQNIPAGFPLGDKRIELVDEAGRPVATGQVGEILVKSRYLSPGYWRQPALNEEKFTVDPVDKQLRIFHTGDLGYLHPDGCLEHLGRKDSQIKIRGFRVNVAEVEAIIHQHPGVKNVAVIAQEIKHIPSEKQLVAYVEVATKSILSKQGLRDFLTGKLPDYMLPTAIQLLDSLPLTPTGKVNRAALPKPEEVKQDQRRAYIGPRDGLERQLTGIWEHVLGAKPVGVQDDYFELGGNSLLAAQLFTQIEKVFGKKLPLATLFQAPTIEQQAAILRQQDYAPDWSSLVALRTQGQRPPLFFAAPVGGNVLSYRDLVMHLPSDQPCYGLQALGLDGTQTVHRSVHDIAAHYINEIRAVQPDGPYYLLGSSFGGLVVYEMAQQLHDQGQSIALVVMFDAYGPNYPRRQPRTSRLRRKVYRYLRRIDTHISNLAILNWKERALYVRVKGHKLINRLARRWRNKLDQIRNPLPRDLGRVRAVHMGASKRKKRYLREPRRFSGRLVLFRAAKQILGAYPDPKLGWGTVVGDQIEVYEIPGHHTSIIYEPRVRLLADKLNPILDEVQATQVSHH
ncbi:MAG: amino acid adenylation domain-containing protein [Anaerolineales bacterium]|nr:amino acid adenylation domain-containing protein [Anaerolineales bacterium]